MTPPSDPLDLQRPRTVAFEARIDAQGGRVVAQPVLANECDRPEASALSLVRELLPRLPLDLRLGQEWSDTSLVFVCRSGLPITVRTTATSRVVSISGGPAGANSRVTVARELRTTLEGQLQTAWRTVTVTGAGDGRQEVVVDAPWGSLAALNGSSRVTIRVRDSAQPGGAEEVVVQDVELRAERDDSRLP